MNGNNLYVKNFPKNWSITQLTDYFKPFGETNSVVIMNDETTNDSKGFGFVCFKEPDDAKKAKDAIHGQKIEGVDEPVYVEFALKKA